MIRSLLFLGALLPVLLVCAEGPAQEPPRKEAKRKVKYIDIHTHVGRYYWGEELTVEGLIKLMDQNGIERACVLPLISPEACLFPQVESGGSAVV